MTKRIFLLFQIALLGISSIQAITKEEMEQAQATLSDQLILRSKKKGIMQLLLQTIRKQQ